MALPVYSQYSGDEGGRETTEMEAEGEEKERPTCWPRLVPRRAAGRSEAKKAASARAGLGRAKRARRQGRTITPPRYSRAE